MNYLVDKKVFATLSEANAYANWYLKQTRIVLAVLATNRKVTHIWKEEEKL